MILAEDAKEKQMLYDEEPLDAVSLDGAVG